jgi:hypothetical protein
MDELIGTGVVGLLFGLRCIVPLALTLGVAYLMNRTVDRWEREGSVSRKS